MGGKNWIAYWRQICKSATVLHVAICSLYPVRLAELANQSPRTSESLLPHKLFALKFVFHLPVVTILRDDHWQKIHYTRSLWTLSRTSCMQLFKSMSARTWDPFSVPDKLSECARPFWHISISTVVVRWFKDEIVIGKTFTFILANN